MNTENEKTRKRENETMRPVFTSSHLLVFCCLFAALLQPLCSRAADQVTEATITITNFAGIATNGTATLTVNGDTRTATNIISANPAIFFYGTNSMLHGKTNLYNHLALYPIGAGATRLTLINIGTNSFKLRSQVNQALAGSVAGLWGTISFSTVTITNFTGVTVPLEYYSAAEATNIAYELTRFFSLASNAVAATAMGLSNHLSQFVHQIASNKTFYASTNRNGAVESAGRISGTNVALTNLTLIYIQAASGTNVQLTNCILRFVEITGLSNVSGFLGSLTNGQLWSNIIAQSRFTNGNYHGSVHVLSNGVFYSPDIRTPILTNLISWGNLYLGDTSSGVFDAWALQQSGGTNFQLYNSDLLGSVYAVRHSLGGNVLTFLNNIPASDITTNWGLLYATRIYTPLLTSEAGTNKNLSVSNFVSLPGSTNLLGGDASFPRSTITTVANGHNTINVGTNVYIDLTGSPTAAWTWGGITGGNRDGKLLKIRNSTGYPADILHNSGTEPTASFRITTPTSTNITVNNSGWVEFIYDASALRWQLVDVFNTATPAATATNALSTLASNSVLVTSALTNVNLIEGSNVTFRITNTSGTVDFQISGPQAWRPVFVMTNAITITNTTTATSFVTNAIWGTNIIPANVLLPGRVLHFFASGYFTSASANMCETGIRFNNATLICTNLQSYATSLVNDLFEVDIYIRVGLSGASGSVLGKGKVLRQTTSGASASASWNRVWKGLVPTAVTIDTTTAQVFDAYFAPGATTHGLTIDCAFLEINQ